MQETREQLMNLVSMILIYFLENIEILFCPIEFDTGAHKNMILSVPGRR